MFHKKNQSAASAIANIAEVALLIALCPPLLFYRRSKRVKPSLQDLFYVLKIWNYIQKNQNHFQEGG